VSQALFAILETQRLLEGGASLTLIPSNPGLLADLLATTPDTKAAKPPVKPLGNAAPKG